MLIGRAVRLVGVMATLAGSVTAGSIGAGSTQAAAAGPGLDVTPVLTSTPFASPPGQRVTHTITLSATGTGTLTATRVTFTTTVDLDGVTATTSAGNCPIVTPLTVVCELGNVAFTDGTATAAKVMITGTVHPGTAPGTLVQNLVNVTSAAPDANPANNVTSNAYLVAGGSAAPVGASASAQPSSGTTGIRGVTLISMIAVLALAVATVAALIVVRRRRSSPGDGNDDGDGKGDGSGDGDGRADGSDGGDRDRQDV